MELSFDEFDNNGLEQLLLLFGLFDEEIPSVQVRFKASNEFDCLPLALLLDLPLLELFTFDDSVEDDADSGCAEFIVCDGCERFWPDRKLRGIIPK